MDEALEVLSETQEIYKDIMEKIRDMHRRQHHFIQHWYQCKFSRGTYKLLWKTGKDKNLREGESFMFKTENGSVKFCDADFNLLTGEEVLDRYPQHAGELLFNEHFFLIGEMKIIKLNLK